MLEWTGITVPAIFGCLLVSCGQHQRSIHGSLHRNVVRHLGAVKLHGKAEFNGVIVFPRTAQRKIAAWTGKDWQRTPIDLHTAALGPIRDAQTNGNIGWLLNRPCELGPLLAREVGILPQFELLFRPAYLRWNIKVHIDRIVVVEVDRVVQLSEFLDSSSVAAPERVGR